VTMRIDSGGLAQPRSVRQVRRHDDGGHGDPSHAQGWRGTPGVKLMPSDCVATFL
jgi:hypothetical protein